MAQSAAMQRDVRTTVRVLMGPVRVLGLFPLSLDHSSWSFRLSLPRLFLSIAVCLLYAFITTAFFAVDAATPHHNVLIVEVEDVDRVLLSAVPILSICELLCCLDDFNESLSLLEAIEAQLIRFGKFVQFDTSARYMLANVALALASLGFRLAKNVITGSACSLFSAGEIFYYFSLFGDMIALTYWFVGTVGIATKLLSACNQELLLYSNVFFLSKSRKVEKLARAHHSLCLSSTYLNEVHGLLLATLFLTCFVLPVSEAYRCILLLTRDSHVTSYLLIAVKLCTVCVCFSLCFQIVTACKGCTTVAKEFNILLYQLMLDDKTNEISGNHKLRLHIAMKREVVFTASGFFKLDYALVHSMIAAATTYLVILFQFGQQTA